MKRQTINISFNILLFSLSVIILLLPALLNGYPLLFSDAGTYIYSGFAGFVPVDRPIMYGLFVRHISMAYTLWFVIILQAIITTFVILYIYNCFLNTDKSFLKTFITIGILCILTGIGNYTSQIMPDIFAALSLLLLPTLFYAHRIKWYYIIPVIIIIIFSNLSHFSLIANSSVIAVIAILIVLLFRKKFFQPITNYSILLVIFTVIACWVLLPTVNYYYKAGFTNSRAKNVVLLASLTEKNILVNYLEKNCSTKNYSLCKDIDKLRKFDYAYKFMWQMDSPLYDSGCLINGDWSNCWLQKDKEFGIIINDIIHSGDYRIPMIKFEVRKIYRQLIDFETGILIPQVEGSSIIGNIKTYLKRDVYQYTHANQAFHTLTFETSSSIQLITVVLSLLIMTFAIIIKGFRNIIKPEIRFLLIAIIIGLFINAAVCAVFSNVVNRYQGRVIWLLPFLVIVTVLSEIKLEKILKRT